MSLGAGIEHAEGGPADEAVMPAPGLALDADRSRFERWRSARMALLLAYVVGYVVWTLNLGIVVDRISVLVSVVILLMVSSIGRPWRAWRRLALEFTLYVGMWIAYDETRGAADRLGMPLQVTSVRDADRRLFGGVDPTVWLQDRFFSADQVRWYDVVASLAYYSHFVIPVGAIVVLWVRRRDEWVRFMQRFATVLTIACLSFVLVPTAPPWMAAGGSTAIPLRALPRVERPTGRGLDAINLDAFVHLWDTGRDWANPVAAMPSLHAAFSLFVVVFWFPRLRHRRLRLLALAYPLVMGLALVYLAEHWVVDVLAGWLVVGASFAIWRVIDRVRSSERSVSTPTSAEQEVSHGLTG